MSEQQDKYIFRLFVANNEEKAKEVAHDLEEVLMRHFPGGHIVEIVDVLTDTAAAMTANIFATPTLVKELPKPRDRILGDLSDPNKVLMLLGLIKK